MAVSSADLGFIIQPPLDAVDFPKAQNYFGSSRVVRADYIGYPEVLPATDKDLSHLKASLRQCLSMNLNKYVLTPGNLPVETSPAPEA